jgi:hypothetical protein
VGDSMSTIKVDTINTRTGSGNITFSRPIVADISNVTGTLPAISGTNLTNLDATDLVGAVPSASLGNIQGKGADIASAGTMVIGTDGGYFDITGTTGIATMTVAVGRMFTLQFDGVVILTNSSTLKLSGAANFTTAAGDHLTFVSVAANDVRQIGFGLTDGGSPVTASVTGDSFNVKGGGQMAQWTATTAVMGTENWDTGNFYNTGTYTLTPSAGKWAFFYRLGMQGNAAHQQVRLVIYKNGSAVDYSTFQYFPGTGAFQIPGCCVVDANGTDTFIYSVIHNDSGGTKNYEASWSGHTI